MYQLINQNRQEKIAMYMKQPKKKLAEMLCNCNELIDHNSDYSGSFTYDNKAILNKNRRVKNVVNK